MDHKARLALRVNKDCKVFKGNPDQPEDRPVRKVNKVPLVRRVLPDKTVLPVLRARLVRKANKD
jgi:hypothetical protein